MELRRRDVKATSTWSHHCMKYHASINKILVSQAIHSSRTEKKNWKSPKGSRVSHHFLTAENCSTLASWFGTLYCKLTTDEEFKLYQWLVGKGVIFLDIFSVTLGWKFLPLPHNVMNFHCSYYLLGRAWANPTLAWLHCKTRVYMYVRYVRPTIYWISESR